MGLSLLKRLGAKRISIHGDLELIINKIKGEYLAKHPRLRAYKNVVLDFLQWFPEYQLPLIPINQNVFVDGLATSTSKSKIHFHPNNKYEIEVKHRPTVPDNIRY